MKVTTKWTLALSIPTIIVFFPMGYMGMIHIIKGRLWTGIVFFICAVILLKLWTMFLRNPK